jgi:hypothetical protein
MIIKRIQTIHPIKLGSLIYKSICCEQYKAREVENGYIIYPENQDPIFIPMGNISHIDLFSEDTTVESSEEDWDVILTPI